MPGVLVDGQDVMAMHEATVHAVQRARAGEGPTLLEAKTYRYEDHSEGLNRILREPYRTEEEIEFWRQRDPIDLHSKWLLENDVANQEEIDKVQTDVYEAIDGALQFARESPYPDEADLFTDLFADPIPLR